MSQLKLTKDTYCSHCGTKFAEQVSWPRQCFHCGNDSYKNPIPVVVTIIPVFKDPNGYAAQQCGWLIEQRNIDPQKGGWAFPSGYIDFGETWQQAAARELQEEVGLTTKPEDFKLLDVISSAGGNMLIFCTHDGVYENDIKFEPNHEVTAIKFPILPSHAELCFPTHNEIWTKYYDSLH